MLLFTIRGPELLRSLKIFNTVECNTYAEACQLLGLLENDNHWIDTMRDAELCMSPIKIRNLFAISISNCGLSYPVVLWKEFKESMSDDIFSWYRGNHNNTRINIAVFQAVLIQIQNKIFLILGKLLHDYGFPVIDGDPIHIDILEQYNYNLQNLREELQTSIPQLSPEQRQFFDLL